MIPPSQPKMPLTDRSCLLTPPGAGAIAVILIEGPRATAIVERVFHPSLVATEVPLQRHSSKGFHQLRYGEIHAGNEVIDDVVMAELFTGYSPSYHICAHGGVRVVERILQTLDQEGAPLNEVSRGLQGFWPARNRIDQEAVAAMVEARTARAVRFLASLRRMLPNQLHTIAQQCRNDPQSARAALELLLSRAQPARNLTHGVMVTILGPPNCGKSTLFNRLVGRSATVTSPIAGTTRDWVSAPIEQNGIPITLVDTAGQRNTSDPLESQAIRHGLEISERSQLNLLLFDVSKPLPQDLTRMAAAFPPETLIIVGHKADRTHAWSNLDLNPRLPAAAHGPVYASSLTGEGLDLLRDTVAEALGLAEWDDCAPAFFTRRQVDLARKVLSDLSAFPAMVAQEIEESLIGIIAP